MSKYDDIRASDLYFMSKLDIILGWSIIPNMIKSYGIVTWAQIGMSAD